MNIDNWLAQTGLAQYAALLRANDVDATLLARLTGENLKEIGITSLGHRMRLLEAIAALATGQDRALALAANTRDVNPATARDYTPRHLAEKILQSRSALEGERKQVSVLFADVQGSMELAGQLDPEQWHRILEGFFAILSEGVHRFEGTVNQYTGDGIMALFGAPIAHEDHAQRACFAALHLQREIAHYAIGVKREHGVGFSTRMGINSGEVVVGRIGDDLRMDYTAQGHTVGLAQRMESLAEPNTCYLSAATAALAGGYFALEDLGEFRVKGVAAAVRVHRLAGVGAARTRLDVSRQRGLSRFVGRAADLRTLEDALGQAAAGNGQVVGVVAEAGTGKSRLCFEFLETCRSRGMRTFEGRAVAHGRNIPLLPIQELLRAALGIGAQDNQGVAREKIAGRLVMLDGSLAEMLPMVFEFLGVGDAQRPAPALEPALRQRQLLTLMRRLTSGADEAKATVVMIEDLHWLDHASTEFLEHMIQACPGTRNLLLLNFRPEFDAPWMHTPGYHRVALMPLGPEGIGELIGSLLGSDASIAALATEIHAHTGGNPFFAEEVVQSLMESGQLAGAPGALRLLTPVARLEVPPTVQALLAARIDRLPERDKQLLQVASVIGKDFAVPLLLAVAELAEQDVLSSLETLRQAGFVHELALYPVAEYAFRHPLTQEVARATQLRERRRQVHAAVARAIEMQDAGRLDERAALLAHHWEEAGMALGAARWHVRAAQWPGCPDFASVMHHWERVRVLLRDSPDDREGIDMRILACTRLLTLGQRTGTALAESRELLEEGQALAGVIGDRRAEINLALAYGWALVGAGEVATCLELASGLRQTALEIDDTALKANVWGSLVLLNSLAARFAQALEMVEQGQAVYSAALPAGRGIGSLNAAATLSQFRGFCLVWMGRLPEALAAYDRSLELADDAGELAVFARVHSCEAHYLAHDPQRAFERARQAQQICQRLGEPTMLAARVHLAFGYAHLAANRATDAAEAARAALGIHRDVDRANAGQSAVLLAQALLQGGDFSAAMEAADEAIAHCRYSLRGNYEAIAHAVLACALLRRDGAAAGTAAETALAQAAALIETTGSRTLEPALCEWRAELAATLGDETKQRQMLLQAEQGYREIGATGHASRLAALREERAA